MNNVVAQRFKNENEKFCTDCAANINMKAEICPKCGVRQIAMSNGFVSAQNGKSRVIAALLAFSLVVLESINFTWVRLEWVLSTYYFVGLLSLQS